MHGREPLLRKNSNPFAGFSPIFPIRALMTLTQQRYSMKLPTPTKKSHLFRTRKAIKINGKCRFKKYLFKF